MPDVESPREVDLQPHPRILPMLGEINLAQWQCIAELIDNALDPFVTARREGRATHTPEIHINIPTRTDVGAKVTVRDNGPGLDVDGLTNAVRAGWTGNEPMGNLGLFGMGFNIATARLGTVTKVWSTREGDAEWNGLVIDFDELQRQRHFRTQVITRPKADSAEHGTEVSIERIKPDQVAWLARTQNRNRVLRWLERAYSSLLRPNGVPVEAKIFLNTRVLRGRQHCVWGDANSPARSVEHTRFGEIEAYQPFDFRLADRSFCTRCWYWLRPDDEECAACNGSDQVVSRQRRVRGWLGIQRYLDERDYGIDFVRHGRKIETANRDLFSWESGEGIELEYPIDDPRQRGRIVGEVHLDHCRVTYTKDRFDRNDPAWEEMIHIVRGEGPLQPTKARQLGYPANDSPLFRLYQGFRRSTPKTRGAGGYQRILVIPDNDRAREMAERFQDSDPEYLSDDKWWELAVAADEAALAGDGPAGGGATEESAEDFWDDDQPGAEDADDHEEGTGESADPPPRDPLLALAREYRDEVTDLRWDVAAFAVRDSDPELGGSENPWRLRRTSVGTFEFLVNIQHSSFRSATLTPLDALLSELAWWAMDFVREQETPATFGRVLTALRERYATHARLDPVTLTAEAAATVRSIARSIARHVDHEDARALFDELSSSEQEEVVRRAVASAGSDSGRVIEEGRFLEYAPRSTVVRFLKNHPEWFFDGRYWDVGYESLDLGVGRLTDEARQDVLDRYTCLLTDAVWLAEREAEDLHRSPRARILRGALALELLDVERVPQED